MSEPSKPTRSKSDPDLFDTSQLKANLKTRSLAGGITTMTAQGFKFGLTLLSNIILGRLLSPQDYGLVGMVTAVTGFVVLFKDLGLSMATIQKEEINHSQISALFWINVIFSIVTALLTVAIAPIIAWFYQEPRLVWITIALSSGFIISGLATQHSALLSRQMQFGKLAIIDILSTSFGIVIACIAASFGLGYWSLVLLPVAAGIPATVGAWSLCKWRPGSPKWNYSEIRSMLAFGGNLTGFSSINYFARNLDNVLIGRFWGAQQLGFYAKAYQLLLLPLNQINAPIGNVAIPTLSRLMDSPDRYRRAYLRILEKLMLITMPLMVFMMVSADWIIQLLLGDQWSESSRIFIWLGIAGLLQPIANSTGWLFVSQGRAHHQFRWGLIGASTAIVSFLIGLPWGATGVAISYSLIWLFVCMPLLFWFVGRTGPVKAKDFYFSAAPFVLAVLCSAAIEVMLRQGLAITNPLIGCSLNFVVTLITFPLALAILPVGRLALLDCYNLAVKRQFS